MINCWFKKSAEGKASGKRPSKTKKRKT